MRKPSTLRRLRLADFIDSFGNDMVQKCSTCRKHNRVCRVHVRSGRCSECNRRNQRCDAKITESEFRRLVDQKKKLKSEIDSALAAQEKALEDLRTARAREERLRQQRDLVDRRADEAISVESRTLEEEESLEFLSESAVLDTGPSLGPSTWSALEDLPLEFFDLPVDTGQEASCSS